MILNQGSELVFLSPTLPPQPPKPNPHLASGSVLKLGDESGLIPTHQSITVCPGKRWSPGVLLSSKCGPR